MLDMQVGILIEVPTYVPGSGAGHEKNITEVEPLRGRHVAIEIFSPQALLVRVHYHCARVGYLEREIFYVAWDLLGLLRKGSPEQWIKEKLESFRYLCGEARELLVERLALVEAAREEKFQGSDCGAQIAACLRKSFLEWTGIIAASIAVTEALKKYLAARLEKVATQVGASLLAPVEEGSCADSACGR
ncbi:MAG: hypothetical protein ACPLQP_01100 [Moorellaceae bacterium]